MIPPVFSVVYSVSSFRAILLSPGDVVDVFGKPLRAYVRNPFTIIIPILTQARACAGVVVILSQRAYARDYSSGFPAIKSRISSRSSA